MIAADVVRRMEAARAAFEELRRTAEGDPGVLGFVLAGSRGRGFAHEESDYDCALFVREERRAEFEHLRDALPRGVELRVFTPASFRAHAAWGSELTWDRYTWAHLRVEADRTGGELQRLLDEKARVPPEHLRGYVAGSLDGYLNQLFRSLKCLRAGDLACARLEAAGSVRPLLQALFAVHDRRLVPYYKYLAWELERFPLHRLELGGGELVRLLLAVQADADAAAQRRLYAAAERLFRVEGFGPVFDSWGPLPPPPSDRPEPPGAS
jgi:predicted nucleotidyltransferase